MANDLKMKATVAPPGIIRSAQPFPFVPLGIPKNAPLPSFEIAGQTYVYTGEAVYLICRKPPSKPSRRSVRDSSKSA